MNNFLWSNLSLIVFMLLVIKLGIQFYLNFRQKKHVYFHRQEVPQAFSMQISVEEHHKAADYTIAKIAFSNINLILEFLITLIWLFAG